MIIRMVSAMKFTRDHFFGPHNAIGLVCVSVGMDSNFWT